MNKQVQKKIRLKQLNAEVLVANEQIVKVQRRDIQSMKEKSLNNRRKRIRLCAHRDVNEALHEMLIVLGKSTYVRPHKHSGKSESFHIIEGSLDVVIFDEDGNITEVVRMGDYSSGRIFYYRISDSYFHTPLIRSETVAFHETTNGPFDKSDTIFAKWAPEESDIAAGREFMEQLDGAVKDFVPST